MAPAATSPAAVRPPPPGAQGPRCPRLPVQGERPPARPSGWRPPGSGLCSVPAAVGGSVLRPGRPQHGMPPELSRSGPPAAQTAPLSAPARGERVPWSPWPSAAHGDLDSCPLIWGIPVSLLPPPPLPWARAWPGRWRWQQVLLLSPSPALPPEPQAQGPREGSCGLCHAGLAGLRSPGPRPHRASPSPSLCPGPRGRRGRGGGGGAQREGPVGPASPPGGVSVPVGCPAQPVPPPTGPPPAACPRANRAAVCGVASSPSGWVGSPSPPPAHSLSVSLRIFECDFKVRK